MRILLVSGSYPPDRCGVGDYTHQLFQALRGAGLDVECLRHVGWGLHDSSAVLRAVDAAKADILHIQYPTVGYAHNLGPQLLSCRRPCIVTIHEVTQAHYLRKLSLYGFAFRAKRLIFTDHYEERAAVRLAPWIKHRTSVIPIGSNVRFDTVQGVPEANAIGYFGLIRPGKGLEQVIELARIIKERGLDYRVVIIGAIVHGHEGCYHRFRSQSSGLPVEWKLGLDGENLSSALASCKIAYLPFPDGASARRSSLLAFLGLGTPVITTWGNQSPVDLRDSVQFTSRPEEALEAAIKIIEDRSLWKKLGERALVYAQAHSWERIVQQHREIYEDIAVRR